MQARSEGRAQQRQETDPLRASELLKVEIEGAVRAKVAPGKQLLVEGFVRIIQHAPPGLVLHMHEQLMLFLAFLQPSRVTAWPLHIDSTGAMVSLMNESHVG